MERFIHGPGLFAIEVVGESHYQPALAAICGGRCFDGVNVSARATLVVEDDNPHDHSAVRVEIGGRTVGHLSRAIAPSYRYQLSQAGFADLPCMCDAVIRGGWDRGGDDVGNFGVWLDLPEE